MATKAKPGRVRIAGSSCLVTGGAGFIGSHLVEALCRAGAREVRVVDNLANGKWDNLEPVADEPGLVVYEESVLDWPVMAAACQGADVVFHLACLGVRHSLHAPFENHQVNAEGTLVTLEAARQARVKRFIYVSTSEIYGTAQYAPMDEGHPPQPMTVYGASKLAGECYARAYHRTHGFPAVMVRPFNNYGPRSHYEGDAGEVIPRFVTRALAGLPPVIFGDGTQTRDFIFVTDTARALIAIAEGERCLGETVNVGSGAEVTVNELAETVLRAVGRNDLRVCYDVARPGDVLRLCADTKKLGSLVTFAPQVSFADGLGRLVAWFRQHPEAAAGAQPVRNWEAA